VTLKGRLTWAFLAVAAVALALAFLGLNVGMYATMMGLNGGGMMSHVEMMAGEGWLASTIRWSLWSSLAALALAGVTGLWTAGRITRSLQHLRDAAQELDLRDLSRRVPVDGRDEIADVARAFNRMCDRLEAEERSRRQLLADVAHELRHPLAVMQGRLDLIQDGKVPADAVSLLPLEDEVIRLTRLVGDLRDLSLAEVGRLSLRVADVDIGAMLTGLCAGLEPVAAERGISLAAEVAPSLPTVPADPDRIRQVFANLLANALQYAQPGGHIGVRAEHVQGSISIQVWDDGPGIEPEDLPHIFDRFYRAEKSRSRERGGSGLGLAIVRSLVELHHGRVTVDSAPGRGTCFTVLLPVGENPAQEGRSPTTARYSETGPNTVA
jgi:signal transduction histidine kinase